MFNIFKKPPYRPIFRSASTAIVSQKGGGKSAYMACYAQKEHNNLERKSFASEHIEKFKAGGYESLELPQTLVYSDTLIQIWDNELNYMVSSNDLNCYELQVPNDIESHLLFPFGSVLLLDEIYKAWGNRESSSLPERVVNWWWITRHLGIDLILFFQEKNGIDKKIRENLTYYRYIKDFQVKYYKHKADKDGYRQIKSVKFTFWDYDKYEYFVEEVPPISKTDILKILWRLYNPTMWFPFNIFHRMEKSKFRDECFKELERLYIVKETTEKFKFNPFELYDSFFFESVQYIKKELSIEEYKEYAKNLKYAGQDNNLFNDKQKYSYQKTIKDIYDFGNRVSFRKPETYTKDSRARNIKEKREKQK
ncbi:MAG: hypothetical protein IJW82_07030 [Clostridia bacterium]|nr:hypothetical protein [Clostridia bacterium]